MMLSEKRTLSEHRLNDFIEILASSAPAPGGGSTAALAGALGAALLSMVANLTLGKEKYKDKEPLIQEILRETKALQEMMTKLIDKDTQAFNGVTAVFGMPKNTEEEKALRREALNEALKKAAMVPFAIMEEALAALKVLETAWGNTNPAAASDLGVSALCLKTALHGAWLNVLINLGSINDQAFVKLYREQGEKLIDAGNAIADRIYDEVVKSLQGKE